MMAWRDGERVATLIKSPFRPVGSAPYRITQQGVRGIQVCVSTYVRCVCKTVCECEYQRERDWRRLSKCVCVCVCVCVCLRKPESVWPWGYTEIAWHYKSRKRTSFHLSTLTSHHNFCPNFITLLFLIIVILFSSYFHLFSFILFYFFFQVFRDPQQLNRKRNSDQVTTDLWTLQLNKSELNLSQVHFFLFRFFSARVVETSVSEELELISGIWWLSLSSPSTLGKPFYPV